METETTLESQAAESRTPRSLARHLPTAARVAMGLMFLVFGLNP